jgi:hypothetical protein
MTEDAELLRQYAQSGSETAFANLVGRESMRRSGAQSTKRLTEDAGSLPPRWHEPVRACGKTLNIILAMFVKSNSNRGEGECAGEAFSGASGCDMATYFKRGLALL